MQSQLNDGSLSYQNTKNEIKSTLTGERQLQNSRMLILFILNVVITIVISACVIIDATEYNVINTKLFRLYDPGLDVESISKFCVLMASSSLLCILVYFVFLGISTISSKMLIHACIIMSILFCLFSAASCAIYENYIGAMVLLGVSLLELYIYRILSSKMPFSAELLDTAIRVLQTYPSTFFLTVFVALLQTGCVMFLLCIAFLVCVNQGSPMYEYRDAICTFIVFSGFWIYHVFGGILRVSISSVFCMFFFLRFDDSQEPKEESGYACTYVENNGQSTDEELPPYSAGKSSLVLNTTLGNVVSTSVLRATSMSLGSIAMASLLLTLVRILRYVAKTLLERNSFMRACLGFLLVMAENMVSYFNHYAYVQVAMYGKPYTQAARDAWRMFEMHGGEIIMNDNILSFVAFIFHITNTIMTFLLSYITASIMTHQFKHFMNQSLIICILAFEVMFGVALPSAVMGVIGTGVSATLMCFLECPEVVRNTRPETYRILFHL